ncbi:MAG: hypothetical protein ACLFT3_20235, partial [Cyclobacteriaceae bacterium]
MKKITCLIACLTLGVCLIANAQSTYYVSSDGDNMNDGLSETTAWETINYAVANAQSNSTIVVLAGIYSIPQVVVDKALTIRGEGQPQLLPDANPQNNLLTITSSGVIIENFIIDGANQVTDNIILTGSATLDADTIRQNIIRNATGNGILINSAVSNFSAVNNFIINNNTGITVGAPLNGSITENNLADNS